jgi:hypothetical protein
LKEGGDTLHLRQRRERDPRKVGLTSNQQRARASNKQRMDERGGGKITQVTEDQQIEIMKINLQTNGH